MRAQSHIFLSVECRAVRIVPDMAWSDFHDENVPDQNRQSPASNEENGTKADVLPASRNLLSFLFSSFIFLNFLHRCVCLPVCMRPRACRCLWKSEETMGSPETGITSSYMLPNVDSGNQAQVLCEKTHALDLGPSLQPISPLPYILITLPIPTLANPSL